MIPSTGNPSMSSISPSIPISNTLPIPHSVLCSDSSSAPDQPTRSVSPRLDMLSKKDIQVPATQPADSSGHVMAIDPTLLSNDVSFLLPETSFANSLKVLDVIIQPPKHSCKWVLKGRIQGSDQRSGQRPDSESQVAASTQPKEGPSAIPTPPIASLESASQPPGTATGICKSDGKRKASLDPEHPQQPARKSQRQPKPSRIIQEELEIQQEFADQKTERRTHLKRRKEAQELISQFYLQHGHLDAPL